MCVSWMRAESLLPVTTSDTSTAAASCPPSPPVSPMVWMPIALQASMARSTDGERPPLPAIALTTDTSILTSIGNDYGYAEVFAKQVKALGREGDVAVALSTSGNSPNVLRAVAACKKAGIITVGLTGGDGGKLGAVVDHHLRVSASRLSPRIQETHILVGHVICELVDCKLFGRDPGKSEGA